MTMTLTVVFERDEHTKNLSARVIQGAMRGPNILSGPGTVKEISVAKSIIRSKMNKLAPGCTIAWGGEEV